MKHLFRKYFHSLLEPDEFEELERILRNAGKDALLAAEIRSLWDETVGSEKELPPPNSEILQKLKFAILKEKSRNAQRKISIYFTTSVVAAVLLVALIIGNWFIDSKTGKNQVAGQNQTISTPYGARSKMLLPDSSVVWLNSGSNLSFHSPFGEQRRAHLVGEAFFDVVKSDKPFVVTTKYGEIRVHGTSFNIRAFSDDISFETTLVSGSVSIITEKAEQEMTLQPGQQAVLADNKLEVRTVETKYFTSWKEGKLLFSREPFPRFIKKLERWYNVKIEYSDPRLDALWYTGTIEMESISEVMEMIGKAAPVETSFDNKTRIFTIKMKGKQRM